MSCAWVMLHFSSHVTFFMSHLTFFMSHVTYEWLMSHVNEACHMWISHFTCECVSRHITREWVVFNRVSETLTFKVSYTPYGTRLIHVWYASRTHSYLTWLIHMWHASFICDMSHSYVTWLMKNVSRLVHIWHASFQLTWLTGHSRTIRNPESDESCSIRCVRNFEIESFWQIQSFWQTLWNTSHSHVICLIQMWQESFILDICLIHISQA